MYLKVLLVTEGFPTLLTFTVFLTSVPCCTYSKTVESNTGFPTLLTFILIYSSEEGEKLKAFPHFLHSQEFLLLRVLACFLGAVPGSWHVQGFPTRSVPTWELRHETHLQARPHSSHTWGFVQWEIWADSSGSNNPCRLFHKQCRQRVELQSDVAQAQAALWPGSGCVHTDDLTIS